VLTHRFAVFGYHVNGSTGRLFLYGIIVGAVAVFGLSLLLTGARHTSRRGSAARQGLKQSRGETAAAREDRDNLMKQRAAAPAQPANVASNGSPDANGQLDNDASKRSLLHPLGHDTPQEVSTPPVDR